jgi:hypothetical protein
VYNGASPRAAARRSCRRRVVERGNELYRYNGGPFAAAACRARPTSLCRHEKRGRAMHAPDEMGKQGISGWR